MASSSSSIPSSSSMAEKNADDVLVIISEQRRELSSAMTLESDFDLAFSLQMEEALSVSLWDHQLSSSSSPAISPSPATSELVASDISTILSLQAQEFDRLEQECRDHKQSKGEMEKIRTDLDILIHDRKFAAEVEQMPENDWEDYGDNFEKPFDSRCSTSHVTSETFRLYFKALPMFGSSKHFSYGVGIAICDSGDSPIFELQKVFSSEGKNRGVAEANALIEGLNAAISLNLKRLNFYCDYYTIYQFIRGRWSIRQQKLADAVLKVNTLRGKFEWCNPLFVPRYNIKFAFKLARDAIHPPVTKSEESSTKAKTKETCVICLEDMDVDRMFIIDGCHHQYCHSCMKQHVEVKLLHGIIPKCPHVGCKSDLSVEKCRKFLTTRLAEIMNQRIKEASVPVSEKIYCPYARCSALMSKTDVSRAGMLVGAQDSGARKCTKCYGLFCINCKVPWHHNMTCQMYRRLNPDASANDAKLKSLASQNLWRQCVKCNHMIELAEGCYHMTCRCGYEFCYTCGAEWREKKATCRCPLWDEDNILYDDEDDDFDADDYDDDDDDYWDTASEDYYI